VQVLVNPNFLVHKLVAGVSILLSTNGLSLWMRFVPRGTQMRGLMVLILKMAPHIEMFHVEHRLSFRGLWANSGSDVSRGVPRGTSSLCPNKDDALVGHWNRVRFVPLEVPKQRFCRLRLPVADQQYQRSSGPYQPRCYWQDLIK
jgi:hypothetical protein